ncbi:serine hydrolase [Maribacter antarcticus]|uniref:serine hydrolase n=1 Tax=Maribacter antarcticus TaxID=505250 RepID=UPI000688AEC1|nr:serine hydrolase [Maribacter antarcticus]
METPSLGNNLIYQRKLKGYSQEELSQKTEVTIRTIQRIEKGTVNPHLQTVKLLAAALSINIDDLLVLENPKKESIQQKWLLLMHGTPLLGFLLPFCNVLFPLFLWIHKREDNSLYDEHGTRIINFHITVLILYILSFVALITIEKWGFIFFILVIPTCVLIVIANIIYAVKEHKCYYPLAIPFLKFKKQKVNKVLLLLPFAFVVISCQTSMKEGITRLDGTMISADSLTHKIDQLLTDAKVHGMAISVFNKNTPVYQKIFGYSDYPNKIPLTDSTNIYGASLSKAVFSILVMALVEEGVINLDTPLESYLPKKIYEYEPQTRWHDDFCDLKKDSLYQKITARMCLAHTTGFPNWRWIEKDQKLKTHSTPGTKYSYSGEGFVYLQVVLEKLSGMGLEELAQERVFEPLGMKASSYQWNPKFEKDYAFGHKTDGGKYEKDKDNEPRGGSTLETTALDYATFLEAILHKKIVSVASYTEIFSPHIRITSSAQFGVGTAIKTDKYDPINLSYGLGWGYLKTPFGKGVFKEGSGNGFQHYSILFPEIGIGIMIMTNSDNGKSIFKELLEVAIKDTFTPWEWENYIPYNEL